MTYEELVGKVALVTADKRTNCSVVVDGWQGDCINIYSWISIFEGKHFSFDSLKNSCSILENYKVVLFSGNPGYICDIISIAQKLKRKVVTVFLPEGDVSLYDRFGINSFHKETYECWNAVDVLFSMEEDKLDYYRSLTTSRVEFVHVPIDSNMMNGGFFVPYIYKSKSIVMYGDNNPNCPITVCAVANLSHFPVSSICIAPEVVEQLQKLFNISFCNILPSTLSSYAFLKFLGGSRVLIYPTRWIGSARMPISSAVAGTACIGSDKSHTQKRLFPELACDIYDVKRMSELTIRLMNDADFYKQIIEYAWLQLSFYNMQSTVQRFLNAVS